MYYINNEGENNMLKMNLEFINGILFCRLKGALNRKSTYKINSYLLPTLIKHKIKFLVYNMYELSDIDDLGCEALLNTKSAIKNNKGKIYLCECSGDILDKVKRLHIKRTESERTALQVIEV